MNTIETTPRFVELSNTELAKTAWGIPKFSKDNSLIHGMFTYNVPVRVWYETINDVVQPSFVGATSLNGELHFESGTTLNDVRYLRTFRNPRYQPNRGYIYSSSILLPDVNALGKRRFGYFTQQSGAFFLLENGNLYAVVRTTINGVLTEDKREIDTTGIDLKKGNIFDIQMQWRGVGNYKFFINQKVVLKIEYLGSRDNLTMFNPANPIAFECENSGDNVKIVCGCVDISSEGGDKNGKEYGSIGMTTQSGQVAITGYNQPVLAVRSKLNVGTLINTRDTLALLASAYSDQRSFLRIYNVRDFSKITENGQVWQDYGDGHLEYIEYTPGGMTFDTTALTPVFSCRVDQDITYSTSALFEGRTDIYLTPGDMFVFTMHRETGAGANVGVTFEFAEEI